MTPTFWWVVLVSLVVATATNSAIRWIDRKAMRRKMSGLHDVIGFIPCYFEVIPEGAAIVICGDKCEGPYYGPFESVEVATEWAEIYFLGTRWSVQPLTRPEDTPGGSPNLARDQDGPELPLGG